MRNFAALLGIAMAALPVGVRIAGADDSADCGAAYQSAQRQRIAGHLRAARESALVCARPTCPTFITGDCTTWLTEIDALLPTVVLACSDERGLDVDRGAEIRIDGVVAEHATDGLPRAIDPGPHLFELHVGGRSVEQRVVVRSGEKARRVELRLPMRATATPVASRPVPAATFVFGALAVGFIAAGTSLWVVGSNDASAYNARCAAIGCSAGERASVQRELALGDVAWALAIVSLGVGATFFFTRPSVPRRTMGFLVTGNAGGVTLSFGTTL